jgi:predicted  nucleic acid-binding Zn-ribbon protein|tara:strand:+ start:3143 stop:3451 length:309 start_codon:yes stop_codon:yes gene_type:complete
MADNDFKDAAKKSTLSLQIEVVELENKLDRVADGIEHLKERQEEMMAHISKIKEAVYNPEQGIYARIKELENWKTTHSKLMWMLVSSLVGLVTAAVFTNVIG